MNRTLELFDAFRREIDAASIADLPQIIGGIESVKAAALAKMQADELSRLMAAHTISSEQSEALRHVEARLADIQAAISDQLLTERECAAYRRKTVYALRKERQRHAGPPWMKDGSRILYRKSELLEWLSKQQQETRDTRREPRFPRTIFT